MHKYCIKHVFNQLRFIYQFYTTWDDVVRIWINVHSDFTFSIYFIERDRSYSTAMERKTECRLFVVQKCGVRRPAMTILVSACGHTTITAQQPRRKNSEFIFTVIVSAGKFNRSIVCNYYMKQHIQCIPLSKRKYATNLMATLQFRQKRQAVLQQAFSGMNFTKQMHLTPYSDNNTTTRNCNAST